MGDTVTLAGNDSNDSQITVQIPDEWQSLNSVE
jgi:hypothetical protein